MTSPPGSLDPGSASARRRRPVGKTLLLLTRTLHIYVTMFGLILLIFFSFTGFLLNNGNNFEDSGKLFNLSLGEPATRPAPAIPVELLAGNEHLIAVEDYLRHTLHAKGERNATPDEDDASIRFQFVGPGRKSEYVITKATGAITVGESNNILGTLTAFHTGENVGRVWVWFIDATAIFLFFAAMSGLILWLSLPKRRMLGIIALAISVALCVGAFLWLVP